MAERYYIGGFKTRAGKFNLAGLRKPLFGSYGFELPEMLEDVKQFRLTDYAIDVSAVIVRMRLLLTAREGH